MSPLTHRPAFASSSLSRNSASKFVRRGRALEPQSRFGDKLLEIRVVCPHDWNCGSTRVDHTGDTVLWRSCSSTDDSRATMSCSGSSTLHIPRSLVARKTRGLQTQIVSEMLSVLSIKAFRGFTICAVFADGARPLVLIVHCSHCSYRNPF